jgi:hypothetical protein
MQLVNDSLSAKLQEIVDLRTEIKLQEDKYFSLLKFDEPFEKLKEIKTKIKYLKVELKAKEEHALTFSNK